MKLREIGIKNRYLCITYMHLNSQRAVQFEPLAPIDNQALFVLTGCLCLKTGSMFAQLFVCVCVCVWQVCGLNELVAL